VTSPSEQVVWAICQFFLWCFAYLWWLSIPQYLSFIIFLPYSIQCYSNFVFETLLEQRTDSVWFGLDNLCSHTVYQTAWSNMSEDCKLNNNTHISTGTLQNITVCLQMQSCPSYWQYTECPMALIMWMLAEVIHKSVHSHKCCVNMGLMLNSNGAMQVKETNLTRFQYCMCMTIWMTLYVHHIELTTHPVNFSLLNWFCVQCWHQWR
jgi:hypothetical protein